VGRKRLYTLDLPVRELSVADLRWLLDVPLWAVDGIPFRVTPNEVARDPEAWPEQCRRTLDADLSWPIHAMRHNGRWTILDGVHRLLKATMEGREAIEVMMLGPEEYRSILS
jgi:hypothetical protein